MTEIAFFTRLLDEAPAKERYQLATEQIQHAERFGFGRAWVAQHHFRGAEGGLPSPIVLLANVAAKTTKIRLGTAVITLTLEDPVRVAEDAVVADLLSGGRVDLGIGSGSNPSSFIPFGLQPANKAADYERKLATLITALAGGDLGAENTLYPEAGSLGRRVWQATFSASGGERAGKPGHGLLLSRTQPRPAELDGAPLHELQLPIIDAYKNALPAGVEPQITASRTVFVADDRAEALRFAEVGLRKHAKFFGGTEDSSLDELITRSDTHLGTPDEVAESLAQDRVLEHATEVAIQVHSVDAPHEHVLRSLELFSGKVAPHFGWDVA
ncbi:putative FMN-dependent luciferase-like monooxygenase [Leucobacter denitrificans]|uniref:Putative FMN-dependent luciferase-like monooxygenase n=1 Tax=Leucobacter denitrificans TaxID=683042 RepID=A0A7G9S598_9MICO|nr:putative FMN-dependent luciferase-like monooxygenase [Leucobacter denitrificans]QNN63023.1 putative FMN-dependent luciferase-like monooxygenase [Leucobacter denitrificans]